MHRLSIHDLHNRDRYDRAQYTVRLTLPEDENEKHEQHTESGHIVHGLHKYY